MPLSAKVLVQLTALLNSTSFDLAVPSASMSVAQEIALTNGTGLNQADRIWSDTRTISASATDSLDMAGSLTDVLGSAFAPARIKAMLVRAAVGNTNNVNVTRPASNGVPWALAAGDGFAVKPGGTFLWVDPTAAGVAVTAGTGDLIDIVNSAGGTSVTYDIVIIGASA